MSQTKESGVISMQMLEKYFPKCITKEYSNQDRIEGDNLLFNKYKVELKHAELAKKVGEDVWSKTFNQIRTYYQLPILCTVTSHNKKEVHFYIISPEKMFEYCQTKKRGQHQTIPEECTSITLNNNTRKFFQKIETKKEMIDFLEKHCVEDEERYEYIDLVDTSLREIGNLLNTVRKNRKKKNVLVEGIKKVKNSTCK